MFDNDKYSIEVIATGYAPAKYMLDPADTNENRRVIRNIELVAGTNHVHAPGQVMLLSNLIFEVGKSRITPESYPELDIVDVMMRETHNTIMQLEEHTDY